MRRSRLTDRQKKLAAQYYNLAMRIAGQLKEEFDYIHQDDLNGMATDGLMYAAKHFKPSRGVPFAKWAAYAIEKQARNGIRRYLQLKKLEREWTVYDDGSLRTYPEPIRTPREETEQPRPVPEYEVLLLRYGYGLSIKEVAAEMGISPRRVKYIQETARELATLRVANGEYRGLLSLRCPKGTCGI